MSDRPGYGGEKNNDNAMAALLASRPSVSTPKSLSPRKRFTRIGEDGIISDARFEDHIVSILWPKDLPMPDKALTEEALLVALIPSISDLAQVLRSEGRKLTIRMISGDIPQPETEEWFIADLIARLEAGGIVLHTGNK